MSFAVPHKGLLALVAIGSLNQALTFAWLRPGDRWVARARRPELQTPSVELGLARQQFLQPRFVLEKPLGLG